MTAIGTMDWETYSEAGYYFDHQKQKWKCILKNANGLEAVGLAVYAQHPSTEILSLSYWLPDNKGVRHWKPGDAPPHDLWAWMQAGGKMEAHNSGFEFYIWYYVAYARLGWPLVHQDQFRCSMAKARAYCLPGGLEKIGNILCIPEELKKDRNGKSLIDKLSKPQSPTKKNPAQRFYPHTAPELFNQFYRYNQQDTFAEMAISERMPDLTPDELELWLLDQRINLRGVHIDRYSLDNCIEIIRQATIKYESELRTITGGRVKTASEGKKMLQFLAENGTYLHNLEAETVEEILDKSEGRDLPPLCRRVLEIRAVLASASVKKIFAIARQLGFDDRLRELFVYCGADRTGRFSGRGAQPQNLYKYGPDVRRCDGEILEGPVGGPCNALYWAKLNSCPVCGTQEQFSEPDEWGIDGVELALSHIAKRDLNLLEAMWGDPFKVVAGCLRGLFIAAPGADLIASDFSAIEAVVLAQLAGEQWRLEVFRTHGKIYETTLSMITGEPLQDVIDFKKRTGKHHPLRNQFGKIPELASGYQGSVGAWKSFGADEYMNDDEILANVRKWRAASPNIVNFWYNIERAAKMAIENPGQAFQYRGIAYQVGNDILHCLLPSGRMLYYWRPKLIPDRLPSGKPTMKITYMGMNSDYKKGPKDWIELDTYGGKLTENIVQAVSRDILAYSMKNVERAGYAVVMHVHDEIVSEVLQGTGSVQEFERIMSILPPWAANWPLKVGGGWRGRRYRKD